MQIDWIYELKQKASRFLKNLKSDQTPGFYHYSLSGDLYGEDIKWGLGNTVFAVKIYYTLGLLENLPQEEKRGMANFIKSFQNEQGEIYDPLVARKAFLREKYHAIKNWDFNNFNHEQTKRAETRQAISSLKLLGEKPDIFYKKYPKTKRGVDKYLNQLDWTNPWNAGSHFSQLLFFLENDDLNNKNELIDYAIQWINKLQNPDTGSWYKGDPSLQHKINGTMKVLTGLKSAGKMRFRHAEKLVDLALSARNDEQACDNFNVIYVLKYANEQTGGTYRADEIKDFVKKRLDIYKEYYWPEHGGFSFLKGRANNYYYKAIITKGTSEPDIHGTVMFLWGISLIAQILDVEGKLGFKEFIT